MIEEQQVYFTPDGLGRASIVRRPDGLFQIFVFWKWNAETRREFNVEPGHPTSWWEDRIVADALYDGAEPEPGIYASVEDARREIVAIPAFSDARLVSNPKYNL